MTPSSKVLKRALEMAVRYNMGQDEISPCNICPLLDYSGCIVAFGVKQTKRNCTKAIALYHITMAKEAVCKKK